jgi:U1 small nuclear ribonucleoprotein
MVARLSYDATEQDLESEFGRFGPIERVCLLMNALLFLLTSLQIRIVVDTHQDEKPNKKKKNHRGYAFVVYEREKDMRGNPTPSSPCPLDSPAPDPDVGLFCTDMALKLPISSLFTVNAQIKVY